MKNISDLFNEHILCNTQKELRKQSIVKSFWLWIENNSFCDWHLSLYRLAEIKPLKYISHDVINEVLDFFNKYSDYTLITINELQNELSHSIFSLIREGSSWGKEDKLKIDHANDIINFERIWHPEYQRYCEHIFNHLIRIPLGILGKIKQKDYQTLTLQNRSNILKDNGFSNLVKGFNPTVRNAISHGNVKFSMWEIEYNDYKNNEKLYPSEFAKLFDNLVEISNSILTAILIFIINNRYKIEKFGIENIPLGIKFLLIDGAGSHSGFYLTTLIESDTIENIKQLNIACKTDTLNRLVQKYEILNLANYILKFGGKKYTYFFFILDCGKTIQPVQKLNAERLLHAIKNNEKIESCLPYVFMDSLLWFDSSMFYMKKYFYKHYLKLRYKLLNRRNIIKWRKQGLEIPASRYFIKKIQNKSTNKIRRVEAYIVLDIFEEGTYGEGLINNIIRHAIKKIKKFKVQKIDFNGEIGICRKPNYIWARFYFHDKALRELMFTGWKTKNLIFKVEWFSRWKNFSPIFIKNPHKIHRGIRIEYNPELIKKCAQR